MFTPILFVLAQGSLMAAPVEVRKEGSAPLSISGAVLYDNVHGEGDRRISHAGLYGGRLDLPCGRGQADERRRRSHGAS